MGDLESHADLSGGLCVDRLFSEDQESCRISLDVVDLLCEDLHSIEFSRSAACDSRLSRILLLHDLLCSYSRV